MEEEKQQKNSGQGLGIAGLVLGSIALIISFIPCFGWYALVPGAIAIVLSAIAYAQVKKTEASKGLIIAALIISIVATSIATVQIIFFAGVANIAKDNFEQVDKWSNDINKHINDKKSVEKLENALDTLEGKMDSAHIQAHKVIKAAKEELKKANKEMDSASEEDND